MNMNVIEMLDELAELRSKQDKLTLDKAALIDSVITPEIKARLAEINVEFAPMIESAQLLCDELEAQIKAAVIENGASVKGAHLQAVYTKGRVSWDSKRLEGLIIVLPQLADCRTIGAPSVSLRKV